jgi:hypothetical protein
MIATTLHGPAKNPRFYRQMALPCELFGAWRAIEYSGAEPVFDTKSGKRLLQGACMGITLTIEVAPCNKALELADPLANREDLFNDALKTFVRVRAAQRLAALGGAKPDMADLRRDRAEQN